MTTAHLDIEPFELIGNQRITLQEFQSIFNEQDEDFPMVIDEEFPLVLSREIYSFIKQPTSEEIGQIQCMVFMQIERMQQSVEQSVQNLDDSGGFFHTWSHWAQSWNRRLEGSIARGKIGEIILTFIPKWYSFTSTREHIMTLMYDRQAASEAFERQEFELQLTIDAYDPCVSVYMAPWHVPTPPSLKRHRQALMDKRQADSEAFHIQEIALQATIDDHDPCVSVYMPQVTTQPSTFRSPPRKKRKKN